MTRKLAPALAMLALVGIALVPGPSTGAQTGAQSARGLLQVSAVGFRSRPGRALVALYDREDAWLHVEQALAVRRVPIRGQNVLVTFEGVPRGRDYAVSVLHDENRNDRLDMEWLPLPHPGEGAGASRNPRPSMGPPSWGSSRFRFERDVRIAITMAY